MNNTQYNQMIADFKKYQDQYGMISILPDENTDNGVLFTAEALICIINSGIHNQPYWQVWTDYIKSVNMCTNDSLALLARRPGCRDYNSMDNYTARLALAIIYNDRTDDWDGFGVKMDVFDVMANYGVDESYHDHNQVVMSKKTKWLAKLLGLGLIKYCYNENDPRKYCFYSWFGRSPALLALMDIATRNSTSYFRNICLFISQIMGAYTPVTNLDGRKLAYVAWQALKDRNKLWSWGYRVWCKKLMKDYENGMETVYFNYYKTEDHPIVKYTKIYVD